MNRSYYTVRIEIHRVVSSVVEILGLGLTLISEYLEHNIGRFFGNFEIHEEKKRGKTFSTKLGRMIRMFGRKINPHLTSSKQGH